MCMPINAGTDVKSSGGFDMSFWCFGAPRRVRNSRKWPGNVIMEIMMISLRRREKENTGMHGVYLLVTFRYFDVESCHPKEVQTPWRSHLEDPWYTFFSYRTNLFPFPLVSYPPTAQDISPIATPKQNPFILGISSHFNHRSAIIHLPGGGVLAPINTPLPKFDGSGCCPSGAWSRFVG